MEVILLIIGIIIGGGIVIVFGKNNKRKIEAARTAIIDAFEKGSGSFDAATKKAVKKITINKAVKKPSDTNQLLNTEKSRP